MARASVKPSGYTILVVDDHEETLRATRRLLEREGHRVLLASSGREALDLFRRERPDLLIVDYFMPGMTGEELIGEIRREDAGVQILLQTGYSGEKPAREMLDELDIQGYHDKGDGADRFLVWVRVCLKAHRQLRQVQEVSRLKSEFISVMSHELRTPLVVILGYVEILEASLVGSEHASPLARVRKAGVELLEMIDATLNVNRLEAGMDLPRFDVVPAREVVEQLKSDFAVLPRRAEIELRWEPVDGIAVLTDRRKLQTILKNVIGNALKFTPAGEVVVSCRGDATRCVFAVRDTGVGIAEDHLPIIFDMFRQADSSDTRSYGGLGLGLYIVRRLVAQLGGEIQVASELEKGTTVTVSLPRHLQPAQVDQPRDREGSAAGCRHGAV
jgi:signal transduction histidine kinase